MCLASGLIFVRLDQNPCVLFPFLVIYDQHVYCAVTPVCKNGLTGLRPNEPDKLILLYRLSILTLFWNGLDVTAFVVHPLLYGVRWDEP